MATGIRWRAERRAGELIRDLKTRGAIREGKHPEANGSRKEPLTKLAELGITLKQSSKWQKTAAIPTLLNFPRRATWQEGRKKIT
jgi:hypothetical protein